LVNPMGGAIATSGAIALNRPSPVIRL